MLWVTVLNFVAWYIFIFISVVWIMVLLQNRENFYESKSYRSLPTVSVLVPAYNEEKTIGKTIRSLLNLDYPKNLLEIIVINDASTDRTGKIAEYFSKQGKIKLLTNKKNRGKAYSLNRGIRHAKGELIACIDADSIVEPQILKKMVGYFDDKNVAAVTPALRVWKTTNFLEKIQHAEYLLNVFLRKALAFIDAIHVTPGVFSIYRKSVLLEVGGFETDNLTEDMEIALKIHKFGYKIENSINAKSYTLCPDRWKDLLKQRIRWYRGAIQNSLKYRKMFFNPKYGNLGVFFLPINFLAVMSIIVIFFVMAWNYIGMALNYLWKLYLINWDVSILLQGINLEYLITNIVSTQFFLALLGLAVGAYVLYISFKMNNEPISENKPGYFMYLIFFPFILMCFWALALMYEILRFKREW